MHGKLAPVPKTYLASASNMNCIECYWFCEFCLLVFDYASPNGKCIFSLCTVINCLLIELDFWFDSRCSRPKYITRKYAYNQWRWYVFDYIPPDFERKGAVYHVNKKFRFLFSIDMKYEFGLWTYLNELHGWMTQWPAVFCRMRSLTNAFLLPNSFIANRLSVGWNHDCNWFFKKFDDIFSLIVCMFGSSSSFGVPYNETSSKWT